MGADVDAGIQLLGTLATEVLNASRFDVRSYVDLFVESVGFDPMEVPLATCCTVLHPNRMCMIKKAIRTLR